MKERPHLIVIAINLLHSGVAVETEFRATSLCGMAISHLMAKKANNVASRKELQGWDEIATFLGLPVATAQRWQRSGMPVRRGGRYVYANPGELNSWLNSESASRFPAHVVTEDEDLAPDLKQALAQAKKTKDPRKAA